MALPVLKGHCIYKSMQVKNENEVQSWVLVAGFPIPSPFMRRANFLEDTMKSIALAAALSLAATSAFAGAMSDPVMEPVVIEESSSSSSGGGVLVPLIAILVIWAAMN